MSATHTLLITGAGSGLGRGLAHYFAERGHAVLAADLDGAAAEETARLSGEHPGRVFPIEFDVTRDDHLSRFLEAGVYPAVDVLINNAGLQHVAPLETFPQAQWEHLINVMVNGAARATRAVLPGMRERGYGRIVNIGSIHSLVASPFKSAYVAAKHALLGFSKVLALETADTDVTINTLCPAYIRTPLVDAQIAAQAREHGISEEEVIEKIMLVPMPKTAFITMEEIGAAVAFLLADTARNITGQTITLDGGWTCR